MSAVLDRANNVRPLDRQSEPDERVTEDDAKDASKLAQLLMRILKDVATLKRRFAPRRTDFEDRTVVSGTPLRLPHSFNARVRWWIVDWVPSTSGDVPVFEKAASSDLKTLVLDVGNNGRVTVRVEAAN